MILRVLSWLVLLARAAVFRVGDPDPTRWFGSILRTAQQQLTNRLDIPLETRCRPRWSVMSLTGRMIPIVDLGRWVGGLDGRKRFEDLVGVQSVPGNDPAVARLQNDHLALAVQLGPS